MVHELGDDRLALQVVVAVVVVALGAHRAIEARNGLCALMTVMTSGLTKSLP
jgi:hypothetical protein